MTLGVRATSRPASAPREYTQVILPSQVEYEMGFQVVQELLNVASRKSVLSTWVATSVPPGG